MNLHLDHDDVVLSIAKQESVRSRRLLDRLTRDEQEADAT